MNARILILLAILLSDGCGKPPPPKEPKPLPPPLLGAGDEYALQLFPKPKEPPKALVKEPVKEEPKK